MSDDPPQTYADMDPQFKNTIGRGRGRRGTETEFGSGHGSTKRSSDYDMETETKRGTSDNRAKPYDTKPKSCTTKKGKSGKILSLRSNYFRVSTPKNCSFFQYHVDFEPENDSTLVRKARVRETIGQPQGLVKYMYDGGAMLYTINAPLQVQFPATYPGEHKGVAFRVTVKEPAAGPRIETSESSVLQVFNTTLRAAMGALNLKLVARGLYDDRAAIRLPDLRLSLWPGYITSLRRHENDFLVCCEISHKIMRDENLLTILRNVAERNRGGDFQDAFKREVVGKIVLTDYNNKTYRIDDVDFSRTPEATFERRGVATTFAQYYMERYRKDRIDLRQPLLISNPKAKDIRDGRTTVIVLIPELCRATGLTDDFRSNFQNMRRLGEHTQLPPTRRVADLRAFASRINQDENSRRVLQERGMEIERDIVTIEGRQLKPENILFGNGKLFENDNRADWTAAFRNNQMFQSESLKRWIVVYPKKLEGDVKTFIKVLIRVASGMKYEVAEPRYVALDTDRTADYAQNLLQVVAMDPKLIFAVVPNNNADRYKAIKKITYMDNDIPSQVIMSKNTTSKKGESGIMSVATKVMIQMNCKLGGAPWMVDFPLKETMTIGFDVSHDPNDRNSSYGAFVASMDLKKDVKYYSSVTRQTSGSEISNQLANQLNLALIQFKKRHDALPIRIIFYRDGVGEGDIKHCKEHEIKAIEELLKKVYGVDKYLEVNFTFIIVNKRINTRVFMERNGSGQENPPPGTIVDSVITLPERFDFFLVSPSCRQGTVSPTSYNIIANQGNSIMDPDKIQRLTFKTCHLYYNWSGTLRVPSVVQYAHKLSVLASETLKGIPNPRLAERGLLYFL